MAERFGTVSYHIAVFCAVLYRIHHFPLCPYRAITTAQPNSGWMVTLNKSHLQCVNV